MAEPKSSSLTDLRIRSYLGRMVPQGKAEGINREHGEDDPNGAETVAAPATVSGEALSFAPLVYDREGRQVLRPASQETCRHLTQQPDGVYREAL